jgi:hypothetical protein
VLVLGRSAAVPALSQIVVVPFSTTIRGLAGEVALDERDCIAVRSTLKIEWMWFPRRVARHGAWRSPSRSR